MWASYVFSTVVDFLDAASISRCESVSPRWRLEVRRVPLRHLRAACVCSTIFLSRFVAKRSCSHVQTLSLACNAKDLVLRLPRVLRLDLQLDRCVRQVDLSDCGRLEHLGIVHMTRRLALAVRVVYPPSPAALTSLSFRVCRSFWAAAHLFVADVWPRLRHLDVGLCGGLDPGQPLSGLRQLERLDATGCSLTLEQVADILELVARHRLRHIVVSRAVVVRDPDTPPLARETLESTLSLPCAQHGVRLESVTPNPRTWYVGGMVWFRDDRDDGEGADGSTWRLARVLQERKHPTRPTVCGLHCAFMRFRREHDEWVASDSVRLLPLAPECRALFQKGAGYCYPELCCLDLSKSRSPASGQRR